MKFFDVEPRSREWFQRRLGVCTSSNFHRVVTAKTLKPSSQATRYMAELLGEWITGEQYDGYKSDWMIRGQDAEDAMWRAYEGYTDTETLRGGFFTNDQGTLACSPDRRVGENGLVEGKAPSLVVQLLYVLSEGPDVDYVLQLQGQMLIAEDRDYVDVFSWNPNLFVPPIKVYRDEETIGKMRPIINQFVDTMLAARERLERDYGPFPRLTKDQEGESYDGLWITDDDVEMLVRSKFPEEFK
jgi:YqaJ-like viral recombinase domain